MFKAVFGGLSEQGSVWNRVGVKVLNFRSVHFFSDCILFYFAKC